MARYPEPGQVKTRLARVIGVEPAAALYRAFLSDIEMRFAGGPRVLVWMYEPPDAPFSSLLTPGSLCLPQAGTDLGARMLHCFERLLAPKEPGDELAFDRVIMIGADVPHVRDSCIAEADERLGDHDVVLGPSVDGGYYLIALRRPVDLFSSIEMGTPRVLEQTVAAVRRAGLKLHLLPFDFDVDEAEDVERLRLALCDHDRAALPRTAAVLSEMAAGTRA